MGPLSLLRLTRIPQALGAADGPECVVGAGVGGGLGVADAGESCERLGFGRAAADALAHADGGELRRARKLVGLAVLVSGQTVRKECVNGEVKVSIATLVADEAAFGILGYAPVHPSPDGLADARCGLVGVLSARPPVVL
nr:MAG TPA: hypothetical protein [Caudoviricetes sp.]